MKKFTILGVSLLFIATLFIVYSCSNEINDSTKGDDEQRVLSITERYSICKTVAIYHSEGLDFAFNKIKKAREEQGSRGTISFLRSSSDDDKLSIVNDIVTEFMTQEQISQNIAKFDSFLNLERTKSIDEVSLRSAEEEKASVISFFENVVSEASAKGSSENLEAYIENVINTSEFASFSEIEQNELLLMFAIYIDSSNYWSKNIIEWSRICRGHDAPRLRSDDSLWDLICHYASVDGKGAVIGGTAGAIGGAVGGAMAGGVGAGPGAIAGGVGGAVSGAVAASLNEALSDEMEYIDGEFDKAIILE